MAESRDARQRRQGPSPLEPLWCVGVQPAEARQPRQRHQQSGGAPAEGERQRLDGGSRGVAQALKPLPRLAPLPDVLYSRTHGAVELYLGWDTNMPFRTMWAPDVGILGSEIGLCGVIQAGSSINLCGYTSGLTRQPDTVRRSSSCQDASDAEPPTQRRGRQTGPGRSRSFAWWGSLRQRRLTGKRKGGQ